MSRLEQRLAGALLLVVLLAGSWLGVRAYGAHRYQAGLQAGQQAVLSKQAKEYAEALVKRAQENGQLAGRQAADNTNITKEKDDEIAALRARLAAAPRLRVGPAVCPDRPAASTATESPAGGDGANPSAWVVSAAADRDLKQLIADVEMDLATGRACQAFLQKNGMVP